ncbi:WD40 repeat-like protein [Paxillus ammoniavirescens]|nr:WD40 repeat-like protein [Paxillus ammoniavirescens]
MVSGSKDGSIRTWRVEDGEELGMVMKEDGAVVAVAASGDGRWIATGGSKRTITIWNAMAHEKVIEWEAHTDWLRVLAFSPDSARVASGSRDQTAVIWSTTTGERLTGPLTPLEGHPGWVVFTEFSPNGDRIATGGGNLIRIWRSHIGELIIPPIHVGAWSLVWTPDGQQLIVGCYDGLIKFFDASTGSLLAEWGGHTNIIFCMAVSPNGNFFVSGSTDTTVRIWDTATRQQIGSALQHGGAVNSVDNSPDGTALRHGGAVNSVAISPDGLHLASGGRDREVRVWNLQGIIPRSLLSTDALVNVHDEDSQQVPNHPFQGTSDTQDVKDDEEKSAEKNNPEGVEATLERRPSESSSLRRFLDCPAVASSGGVEDASEQVYANFFKLDVPDTPPPANETPKKRFSKFLNRFSRKQEGRGAKTHTHAELPQAGAGAEGVPAVDPLPAATPKELIGKDEGKQKECGPDAAHAEETDRAATPAPGRKVSPSAGRTNHKSRSRVDRIRKAITRRRDGSAARRYDRLKVTPIACGHMDEVFGQPPLVSLA